MPSSVTLVLKSVRDVRFRNPLRYISPWSLMSIGETSTLTDPSVSDSNSRNSWMFTSPWSVTQVSVKSSIFKCLILVMA